MAIKRTTWHFDNCPCVISFTRERGSDPDIRSEMWDFTDRVCAEHEHLAGEELFQFVREENNRRNIAWGIASDLNPAIGRLQFQAAYDRDRVLEVQFRRVAVPPAERALFQSAVDIQIGPGKVRILDFVVG